jgi:hypothetical protein
MAAMAAADVVTYIKGDKASNSIRNIQEIPLLMKYYFSTMQFMGTAYILTSQNAWAVIWYYAFVVQFNPLGMTLVRKNILSHRTNMKLYALELMGSIPVTYRHGYKDPQYVVPQILRLAAAMWRMGPWPSWVPRNKYLLWTVLFALFHGSGLRQAMEDGNPKQVAWLCHIADFEVYLCISYYLYQQFLVEQEPNHHHKVMAVKTKEQPPSSNGMSNGNHKMERNE